MLSWGYGEKMREGPTPSCTCSVPGPVLRPCKVSMGLDVSCDGLRLREVERPVQGGQSWNSYPGLPVPRAQVYTTSLEWESSHRG